MGTNNYLVDSDNGPKYVSGEVLSRMPGTTTADAAVDTSVIDILSDTTSNVDDSISVSYDLSEDLDDLYAPHIVSGGNNDIIQRPRRTPREIANLGNVPQRVSRLRSGCI